MLTGAFILIMFADEGEGAAMTAVTFADEAACLSAIDRLPQDTAMSGSDTNNGIDWAVCVPASSQ